MYQGIVKHVVKYACFDEGVFFDFHRVPGADRNLALT
jgi:hypothetical protein